MIKGGQALLQGVYLLALVELRQWLSVSGRTAGHILDLS
jgi:hypothetical protein